MPKIYQDSDFIDEPKQGNVYKDSDFIDSNTLKQQTSITRQPIEQSFNQKGYGQVLGETITSPMIGSPQGMKDAAIQAALLTPPGQMVAPFVKPFVTTPEATDKFIGQATGPIGLPGRALREFADWQAEERGRIGYNDKLAAALSIIPGTIGEALDTPEKVAMQLGGEGVMGAVKWYGGKMVGLAERIAPEAIAAIKAAGNLNIPLTAAEITQTKLYSSIESMIARSPFTADIILVMKNAREKQLTEARDMLLERFGPRKETELVGQTIKEEVGKKLAISQSESEARILEKMTKMRGSILTSSGKEIPASKANERIIEKISANAKLAREEAEGLYKKVDIPEDVVYPSTNLRAAAKELIDGGGGRPKTIDKSVETKAREILYQVPKERVLYDVAGKKISLPLEETPLELPWKKFQRLQSEFGYNMTQANYALKQGVSGQTAFSTTESAAWRKLRDAARADMEAFAKSVGGDTWKNWQTATAFYKSGYKDVYANKTIRKIISADARSIFDMVVEPGRVLDIRRLKKVVGQDDFDSMRRMFVESIIGKDGSELPRLEQITRRLAKYDRETLEELLTSRQTRDIHNFARAGKLSGFIQDEISKRLSGIITREPEKVINAIISGDAQTARMTRQLVGNKNWEPVRRRVVEKAIGESGDALFGNRTAGKTLKDLYEPEFLREFFTEAEMKSIDEIGQIKRLLGTSERLFGNPSGTGQIMTALETGKVLLRDPVRGVTAILTAPILARFYLSPTGRRLLVDGLNSNEANASANLARIAVFAKNSIKDIKRETEGKESGE